MTQVIDKILVKAGFEADEVNRVRHRPVLYSGIAIMTLCSGLFLTLMVM